jgi:hypothetical protein
LQENRTILATYSLSGDDVALLLFARDSPGERQVPRPLTEAEKNAAKFPPNKTLAEQILTNAQDDRPVVQDFVPLAESMEWERRAAASGQHAELHIRSQRQPHGRWHWVRRHHRQPDDV